MGSQVSKCFTCPQTASIAKLLYHGAHGSDEGYESDEGNEEGSHESHEGDESNEESTGRRRSGCCTHEEGHEGYEGNESHESDEVSASRVGARLIRNLKIRLAQGRYVSLV